MLETTSQNKPKRPRKGFLFSNDKIIWEMGMTQKPRKKFIASAKKKKESFAERMGIKTQLRKLGLENKKQKKRMIGKLQSGKV